MSRQPHDLRRSSLPELTCRTLGIVLLLSSLCSLSAAQHDIPTFLVEPDSLTVSDNSSVTVKCAVRPSSAKLQWKFDNEILTDNNSYGIQITQLSHSSSMDLTSSELFIPLASQLDRQESAFHCTATSGLGTIRSRTATISKAVLRRFEDRRDIHVNTTVGSNVVLPCHPPYSLPPALVTFRVNQSTMITQDTERYKILPSGNLQILKALSSDQGQYQCIVENKLRGRTRTAKHSVHLHVLSNVVPSQEPAVIMPTARLSATIGESVVLECSAVGNPQPVISWEKYGGSLIPGRYTQKHGNLYLHNVTKEDEGTYLCKADNGLNTLMPDGLKAMMLEIAEPPTLKRSDAVVNVSLGGRIKLVCSITGRPKPQVKWYHNNQLLKPRTGDTRLFISSAEARDQGLYQCFAENQAGTAHREFLVNVDVTKRDTSSLTQSDQNVTDTPSKDNTRTINNHTSAGQKSKRRHQRKHKKKSGSSRHRQEKVGILESELMVPPSKPEVKQLSDTSVMLNWTVSDEGLDITFFRVQVKKIGPKKGSWQTEDMEIPPHVRTFEVGGLRPRATYKFRIAAVYTNNDNKHGPNSDRFEMKLDPVPESKPPANNPIIVEVTPIDFQNVHALNVKWQHNTDHTQFSSPIEGFYIYYRPFHSQDPFQNVTLLEPSVRAHLLINLMPGTEYLIKMQAFNSAGNSSFSNEVVYKTKGESPYTTRSPVTPMPPDVTIATGSGEPNVKPEDSDTEADENQSSSRTGKQSSSEMLYMILGIVLGVMMLLLIVFMFMCWWKQRQQRRMMDAMNDAVRNKFQDSSQRLYTDSLRKKMANGGVAGMNGMNGTIANGHIPRNFHKMNINVNPLSDMENMSQTTESSHHYSSTFHPNGTLPACHRTSDNNCNNINQSKSLQNSLQHLNHHSNAGGESDTLVVGGGESMATPTCVTPSMCKNVPICHNSDVLDRRSISSRSYDQSCDHGDSSYDDTGGPMHGSRHRKGRRHRQRSEEQTTKDQATNTDLSSNDGTMDLSDNNKVLSSSQDSGHPLTATPPPTVLTHNDNEVSVPCSNAV